MFVDRVLSLRDSLDIQKFRLHCYCCVEDFSRIVGWICTAIRHNVVELDLFASMRFHVQKTLVVLKVKSTCITYASPMSGCFPSLKFLDVKVEYPEDDSMGKLFSCCPVLKDLSINATVRDLLVLMFKVSAPELKRLRMTFVSAYLVAKDLEYDISNNAPKLENLDIKQDCLSIYLFENFKYLVKAVSISIAIMNKSGMTLQNEQLLFWRLFPMLNVCLFQLILWTLSFSAYILTLP
ncbi:F-box/LRR-repeat protein [Pyrus ussuriensis x Pyrus communis]|uniref:F-box/LRR-repeat protein n=1 Tax=Pyrus ussuriensis x Pyrus communis TaxID=2448454 RepID=A0A5N5GLL7_9ROSA|nr:F-box/LRR-repeat protein [Pyrus ussuriensis x Pyrus communis]